MSKEKTAPGISPRAGWRESDSYRPLLELDRAGWAWEWLRRNPDFSAMTGPQPGVKRESAGAQPRIIAAPAMQTLKRWGLLFRRKLRLRDFLVARLQPARTGGRGFASRRWPPRCL